MCTNCRPSPPSAGNTGADYFRFDPFLHLRHDSDPVRNEEIRQERLSPEAVVAIEQADEERARALEKGCDRLIVPEMADVGCDHLFNCGAGNKDFAVSYDGVFRLCASLWHPGTIFDLRRGSLKQAWEELVPKVREMRSANPKFLARCRRCSIFNLCCGAPPTPTWRAESWTTRWSISVSWLTGGRKAWPIGGRRRRIR